MADVSSIPYPVRIQSGIPGPVRTEYVSGFPIDTWPVTVRGGADAGDPNGDAWHWRAHAADGATLDEYDAQAPSGHGFADALAWARRRRSPLVSVELVPQAMGLPTHRLIGPPPRGARWVCFRRRTMTLHLDGSPASAPTALTVLGFEHGPRARPVGCYTFFAPDGAVLVSPDRSLGL